MEPAEALKRALELERLTGRVPLELEKVVKRLHRAGLKPDSAPNDYYDMVVYILVAIAELARDVKLDPDYVRGKVVDSLPNRVPPRKPLEGPGNFTPEERKWLDAQDEIDARKEEQREALRNNAFSRKAKRRAKRRARQRANAVPSNCRAPARVPADNWKAEEARAARELGVKVPKRVRTSKRGK